MSQDGEDQRNLHLIDLIRNRLREKSAAFVDADGHINSSTAFGSFQPLLIPPASKAQLEVTERQLGFPLPPFLRTLYSRVANGGRNLGYCNEFFGAEGGWPNHYLDQKRTIGQLVSRSGWRLHERIEAALMQHPGQYVLSDESPDGFIQIADFGCGISVELDRYTGRVYHVGPAESIPLGSHKELFVCTIEFAGPSLEDWFEHWTDPELKSAPVDGGELAPDNVDLSGLDDPDLVWRGLYRFEPYDLPGLEPPTGDELP